VPAIGVVALGLLMVSPIPYRSFKDLRLGRGFSGTVIPVMVLSVLLIEPYPNFFLVGIAYVVSGPLGMAWRWWTGQELLPALADEDAAAAAVIGPAPASGHGLHGPHAEEPSARVGAAAAVRDEAEAPRREATNATSLVDHWSSGGARGEGGR